MNRENSVMRIAAATTLTVLTLVSGAAEAAPEGTFAETKKSSEIGDVVFVEGVVVSQKGNYLYTLRDQGGEEVLVRIPEFLTREKGAPARNERIRISGKWDQKKLDTKTQGIRVITLERLGKAKGGYRNPDADDTPVVPTPPASAQMPTGDPLVIRPTATPEWVDRLGEAGKTYQVAKTELADANALVARSLYQVGDPANLDPKITERQRRAQEEVSHRHAQLKVLAEEARAAGISGKALQLFERRHDLE